MYTSLACIGALAGYMTLALLFFILRLLQQCGSSRVPQPMKDTLEDENPETAAEEVVPSQLAGFELVVSLLLASFSLLLALYSWFLARF